MKNWNEKDYYPLWSEEEQTASTGEAGQRFKKKKKSRLTWGLFVFVICLTVAVSVLVTYTWTAMVDRKYYSQQLLQQQKVIEQLQAMDGDRFTQLELVAAILDLYSYYADSFDEQAMMDAVLKAYAAATGDDYAEYYTEEEYRQLYSENVGDHVGVGINIIQNTVTVDGVEYTVLQIIDIFEDSPVEKETDIAVGDCIYSVTADGKKQTVSSLGYTGAVNAMKGEKGSVASFSVFRKTESGYTSFDYSVRRDSYVSKSVRYRLAEGAADTAIVHISSFDLTTPTQLKETVRLLQEQGVQYFVLDVRNNPGGDLQSIRAVLSYFLEPGDLILKSIDRNGNTAAAYYVEPMELSGDYSSCSVSASEIGMYRNLNMVVLCNENTASAAEVFTATLKDYGLTKTVGTTTFGKGIMQSILSLSVFGDFSGYIKMTTYAYVTKRGVTYHEIGIAPDVEVDLSEDAKKYNFYILPQNLDEQLQQALALLHGTES